MRAKSALINGQELLTAASLPNVMDLVDFDAVFEFIVFYDRLGLVTSLTGVFLGTIKQAFQ